MKAPAVVLAALLVLHASAHATAQIPDEILINGERASLFTEPFSTYLLATDSVKKLEPFLHRHPCSGSWRGHVAFWEVRADKLVLAKLVANPCDEKPKEIPLATFFPGQDGPIPATWYSGRLVVPQGKMARYVHMGYGSQYERYIVLIVVNGAVTERIETQAPPK